MLIIEILKENQPLSTFSIKPSSVLGPDGKPVSFSVVDELGSEVRTFRGDNAKTVAQQYADNLNSKQPKPEPNTSSKPKKPKKNKKPVKRFEIVNNKGKQLTWTDVDANGKSTTNSGTLRDYKKAFKTGDPKGYQTKILEATAEVDAVRNTNATKWAKRGIILLSIAATVAEAGSIIWETYMQLKANQIILDRQMNKLPDSVKKQILDEEAAIEIANMQSRLKTVGLSVLFGGLASWLVAIGYIKWARNIAMAGSAAIPGSPWSLMSVLAFGASVGAGYLVQDWIENKKESILASTIKQWAISQQEFFGISENGIPQDIRSADDIKPEEIKEISGRLQQESPKQEAPPLTGVTNPKSQQQQQKKVLKNPWAERSRKKRSEKG